MRFCLFIDFHGCAPLNEGEGYRVWTRLRATPGLVRALVHTPASASDPFLDDGAPPILTLQLYFDSLADLETAAAPDGSIGALADGDALPTLAAATAEHQAMAVRRYDVPAPRERGPGHPAYCTYLVAYEGPADDLNAWLGAYLAHHPRLMASLPGVREVEVYTRVDWIGALPWPRAHHMKRNKVAFDDPAALNAALQSPIREEMRAHFRSLPPFSGRVTHFPMKTTVVPLA